MPEEITLDQPVQAEPGAATFRLWSFEMTRGIEHSQFPGIWHTNPRVAMVFAETVGGKFVMGGKRIQATWLDAEAEAIQAMVNRADFTSKSLTKRSIEKAWADGKLGTGTITGEPD